MVEISFSDAQRDRFARNGFLVLRDAIDAELLDPAFDSVAETVPENLTDFEVADDGDDETSRRSYWGDLEDMEPFGPLNRELFGFAEQLVGEEVLESPSEFTQVVVRYPEGDFASDPGRAITTEEGNPHVDGFEPDGTYRPFNIGATTYLRDVPPRAGGFTVWPGSHWRVAEFFGDHDLEEYSNDDTRSVVGDRCEPFEVVGDAGTVVLWHDKLVHTGGKNLGRCPRVAAFSRFVRSDVEETMREAASNPFRYWDGVEADGIDPR